MASFLPELAVYGHGRPAREGGELQTQSEIIHSLNGRVGLQDGLESKCANPSKKITQPNNSLTPHHSKFFQNTGIVGGQHNAVFSIIASISDPIPYTPHILCSFSVSPF